MEMSMRHSPRVLHMVPALFGDSGVVGGAERYAFELARHMAQQTPTELVTFGNEDRVEQVDGLTVRVLGGAHRIRGQATNPFSSRLIPVLREADVIHCHQTHVVASSVAAATARLTSRRVFTTELGGGGWDVSAYLSTDRWFHGHLHISEYSRRVSGHGDRPWAHVISGGVDAARFAPDPAVPRGDTVVFVGRLLPHKGLDDLIDAAPDDMAVEIIGRPYDPAYFDRLRQAARGKRVAFRTDCDDQAIVDAYRRALCVVLPSVYRTRDGVETRIPELLGQTLLEGMACGAPGVCTSVASLPEVVEDTVSGFVVPPGDAGALRERLLWLRHHRADAAAMGARARMRVTERFQWRDVVERCLSIYAH
jgi:glycosyltransferase involved in cell wall biosynthesis